MDNFLQQISGTFGTSFIENLNKDNGNYNIVDDYLFDPVNSAKGIRLKLDRIDGFNGKGRYFASMNDGNKISLSS
jgi:hypothetical protein